MSTARAARRTATARRAPQRGASRPALRVVQPDERAPGRGRSTVVLTLVLLTIVFLAVFGLVVFQTVIVQTQSEIDELDSRIADSREEIDQLDIDIAELESPERILAEATGPLGMISPGEVLMIDEAPPEEADLKSPISVPEPTTPTPSTAATTPSSATGTEVGQ